MLNFMFRFALSFALGVTNESYCWDADLNRRKKPFYTYFFFSFFVQNFSLAETFIFQSVGSWENIVTLASEGLGFSGSMIDENFTCCFTSFPSRSLGPFFLLGSPMPNQACIMWQGTNCFAGLSDPDVKFSVFLITT